MENNKPTRKKAIVWVMLGLAAALVVGGVFITREPASPFPFLDKYEIVERRTSKDGRLRILVLKADVSTIWRDVVFQQVGRGSLSAVGSLPNQDGVVTEYRSLRTEEGLIKVSNDLSFADDGFGMEIQPQKVRPGYCAIAFTRPKTIFDRATEWIRDIFKKSPPPSIEQVPETIRV